MSDGPASRLQLRQRAGVLLITRMRPDAAVPDGSNIADDRDIFIAVQDDGAVLAFNGHVDLGTGIRTALAQIVAEELDVALTQVEMVLGDTRRAPDQGATIASETIQIAAAPLRRAAAQARHMLVRLAAGLWDVEAAGLSVTDGIVAAPDGRAIAYGALLHDRTIEASLSDDVAVKPVADYRIVGQAVARTDIPAKAVGTFSYVHDLRLPGMLHGRVIRPPYLGHDSGPFVGRSLIGVDEASVADVAGLIAVVTLGDFVGVVAVREEDADRAMRQLRVRWRPSTPGADLRDVERAVRANPSQRRVVLEKGDVAAAMQAASVTLQRSYSWPFQMHGAIGPSCAVAHHTAEGLVVWSGTQNPHLLRADLARLLDMPAESVEVVRMEAAGCYGRNCADDVTGDAALLSRATGRPVRVQLTREQEHAWEPKGAAQICDVAGGITAEGGLAAYDFTTRYPSNLAPMLPLLLTGIEAPVAAVSQMGDRTAIPPYDYPAMRIAVEDMAPILRASWMRGVSALPNTFAHECFIDELAVAAAADPVEYRLRHLHEPRASALVRAVADRAGWQPRTGPRLQADGDILRGQGFAYALYVHSQFPGFGAAWAAWVADVEVNRRTGEVALVRVTVGHDAGLMINPAGVTHQVHGNVIQSASRVLKERVTFTENSLVASQEWGGYPIMSFREVPEIDVLLMHRPNEPALGAGESASVPSAAAIANAIFDATGVRFRSVPFTADVILAGLQPNAPKPVRRRGWLGALGALGAMLITASAGLLGGHAAMPAGAPPGQDVFSASQIARGRALAGIGNCAGCHGEDHAGGYAMATPFGVVHATNISPDLSTGIGGYSYAAFARAMREGIAQDGRQLYPAFPYTAYTRMEEADLLALYAYVMARPAVRAETPPNGLAFPFSVRPLMAAWNLLFHRTGALVAEPGRTAQWNRGRSLVEGLGHCGACHTPRNALGAERAAASLAGAIVDGWEAPALGSLSHAPVPWSEQALYDYLRHGHSDHHSAAAGPMAQVVQGLAAAPDSDIAAMAHYLASLSPAVDEVAVAVAVAQVSSATPRSDASEGARLFQGACGACHHDGDGPAVSGLNISLALHSSLHSDRPDNLVRVVLEGLAPSGSGEMPSFRASLSNAQIAELARFMRGAFAPGRPAWRHVDAVAERLRGG